ncbi:MAG: hypothetical protein ACXQS8_06330, partial [Candidatus Helarchaeales archaeon]
LSSPRLLEAGRRGCHASLGRTTYFCKISRQSLPPSHEKIEEIIMVILEKKEESPHEIDYS